MVIWLIWFDLIFGGWLVGWFWKDLFGLFFLGFFLYYLKFCSETRSHSIAQASLELTLQTQVDL